jgi:hypothetical protein
VAVVAAGSLAAAMILAVSLNPDTYFFYRFQDRTKCATRLCSSS